MIITVTLNPALDKTVSIPDFLPGTANHITAVRTDPGGKGLNVSKVIARLGGASTAVALLGGATGRRIAKEMDVPGITCRFTMTASETRTNLKIVDPARHTNTDLNEPGPTVSPDTLCSMLAEVTAALCPGDIVVLSGSLPQGVPTDTYGVWTAACRKAGALVFLDADGEALAHGVAAKPYLIKPNTHELSQLVGRTLAHIDDLLAAARGIIASGVARVVVSMGKNGALFISREQVYRAEGISVPIGSTVGAGDSMVAALAYAAACGMDDENTARLAIAASAASVECCGSQAAARSAIDALLPRVAFHKI
nr:1-phosphofructokinase [uncultured Agathobaculum sp.]